MKKLLRVTRKIYFAWQEARSTFYQVLRFKLDRRLV